MTNGKLANELQAISRKLDEILASDRIAAIESERRFAEDQLAIENMLQSVEEAVAAGKWRRTKFNVFDVLGCSGFEQAHSSFLAWLLDPGEAHSLGDAFLRQFVRRAIGREPPSTEWVTVSREFRCGDMRFDIHVAGTGWCLVVENKIGDYPWDSQCAKYQAWCKTRADQTWLVYATPQARRPAGPIPWVSYSEIRRILESVAPSESAGLLIEHFCEHVFTDLEV